MAWIMFFIILILTIIQFKAGQPLGVLRKVIIKH